MPRCRRGLPWRRSPHKLPGWKPLDPDGIGMQAGGGFAFGLRLHIRTVLQGFGFGLLHGDGIHRFVAQLVREFQLGGQIEAHHPQQLQMSLAAFVPDHQQVLLFIGKLHLRARDLDARARAGAFLVLRLLQDGLRQRHVSLIGFHAGIGAQRGARGLIPAMLLKSKTLWISRARTSTELKGPPTRGILLAMSVSRAPRRCSARRISADWPYTAGDSWRPPAECRWPPGPSPRRPGCAWRWFARPEFRYPAATRSGLRRTGIWPDEGSRRKAGYRCCLPATAPTRPRASESVATGRDPRGLLRRGTATALSLTTAAETLGA